MSARVVRPLEFTEVEIHTDASTLRRAGEVRRRGSRRYRITTVHTEDVPVSTTGQTHYTQVVTYRQMPGQR